MSKQFNPLLPFGLDEIGSTAARSLKLTDANGIVWNVTVDTAGHLVTTAIATVSSIYGTATYGSGTYGATSTSTYGSGTYGVATYS